MSALSPPAVRAEVKVLEADSTYVMGDNDSKVEARRIAVQEAKRKALELAGAYVESLTQVRNYQLARDEVRTYTAGIVETEVVSELMRGTTEHPEIYIKARCRIDTEVLTARIGQYRDNEELKEQLEASSRENEDLRKERDNLVKQLGAEKDKTKAAETRTKLDAVLSREETNDDTARVWTNLALKLSDDANGAEIRQADLDNSSVVLKRAISINPQNQRARSLLASIYQRNGDLPAAEGELRTAIEKHPSNPVLHMKLGVLLQTKGNYEDALREFHFVERVRPHNPMMLFHTGMTLKSLNRCERAVQYLNRFLKDWRADRAPKQRDIAVATIHECGGIRHGRQRRLGER